jgi:hypothetical protein
LVFIIKLVPPTSLIKASPLGEAFFLPVDILLGTPEL